jgi:trimethylamine--corrinoid protein Co-methyltransferase
MEDGLSSFTSWLAGADMLSAAGMLHGGRVFSPAEMLLDTELFDLVRTISLGFEVDEETLAVEVIEKVGPGEHFLGEAHTRRHMREAWTARFMNKDTWEAWEETGRPEPRDRARERALELMASHEPVPLASGVEERILEVIAEHERDAAR